MDLYIYIIYVYIYIIYIYIYMCVYVYLYIYYIHMCVSDVEYLVKSLLFHSQVFTSPAPFRSGSG